jgi:hypothetical protein
MDQTCLSLTTKLKRLLELTTTTLDSKQFKIKDSVFQVDLTLI